MEKTISKEIKPKQTLNRNYIPVTKWNDCHHWPPIGGMRYLVFNSKTNGFQSAFKRVGSRVLVDEAEFFACVERQNEGVSS